ncbi:DNA mismatch repair protein MutS [Gracilaria domingensis]|nr:DNA mismatch repair protein MutS [Gracilaria domingensis]
MSSRMVFDASVLLGRIRVEKRSRQRLLRSGDEGSMCARIPYFDNGLADIGDDQSLVQSFSTFSGHVERIKRIQAAKYAKDNSALFFENAGAEFDDVNMVPTYPLIWGIPSRSNAFAIAERLGLNFSVIEEARFLLKGGYSENGDSSRVDIEKMIPSLERDKNAAGAAREDTERALREAKTMRFELEGRLHRLRENEAQLRKDQKSAMELEVKQAKKQIAKVILEMQKVGGSAQAAGRETKKLGRMKVPGAETSPSQVVPSESTYVDDVREYDKVIVPRLSANEVEVVQKLSKNELMVAIGAMKAKVKVEEVASANQRKVKQPNVTSKRRQGNGTGSKQLNVCTARGT